MFARSFSIVVEVIVGRDNETVAMEVGLVIGNASAEVSASRKSDELEGLDRMVVSWIGPIIYWKYINWGWVCYG